MLDGAVRAVIAGDERRYEAGDVFEVPADTVHQMAGDGPARVRWEVRPALRTAEFFERLYAQREPGADVFRVLDFRRKMLKAREGYLDALWDLILAQAELAAATGNPALAGETDAGDRSATLSQGGRDCRRCGFEQRQPPSGGAAVLPSGSSPGTRPAARTPPSRQYPRPPGC